MAYRITNISNEGNLLVEGKSIGPNQSTTVENLTFELRRLRNQNKIAVDTATGVTKEALTLRYENGQPAGVEDANGNYLGDLLLAKRSPSDGGLENPAPAQPRLLVTCLFRSRRRARCSSLVTAPSNTA